MSLQAKKYFYSGCGTVMLLLIEKGGPSYLMDLSLPPVIIESMRWQCYGSQLMKQAPRGFSLSDSAYIINHFSKR